MATLNDLIDELTVICEAPEEFLLETKEFVGSQGPGIYSISTEYGDFCIRKNSAGSLEDIRKEVQDEIDSDEDEESWDYFKDFNSDEDARDGFLFGEGWFSVQIDS